MNIPIRGGLHVTIVKDNIYYSIRIVKDNIYYSKRIVDVFRRNGPKTEAQLLHLQFTSNKC